MMRSSRLSEPSTVEDSAKKFPPALHGTHTILAHIPHMLYSDHRSDVGRVTSPHGEIHARQTGDVRRGRALINRMSRDVSGRRGASLEAPRSACRMTHGTALIRQALGRAVWRGPAATRLPPGASG